MIVTMIMMTMMNDGDDDDQANLPTVKPRVCMFLLFMKLKHKLIIYFSSLIFPVFERELFYYH